MIIDAHQHYWDPARGDYGWLTPELRSLYRPCLPDELAPELAARGVGGVIAVQAAPTRAETQWLLALDAPSILGVVGWVDLGAPDAEAQVAALARTPRAVGVRPMLQDMAERDWILRRELAPALDAMAEHELVFDALIRADQMPVIAQLAERHARLSIVLDHLGKPPFGTAAMHDWRAELRRLAARPNVSVKFSGLLTELPAPGRLDQALDAARLALALFGPDRVLWGSDWPVLTLAGSYADWWDLTGKALAPLAGAQRAQVLGGNAQQIYRLEKRACA